MLELQHTHYRIISYDQPSCVDGYMFNPLHPNISVHILHTVLYTYPKVLARKIV